jgi:predicted protein tyrosine phosphatase
MSGCLRVAPEGRDENLAKYGGAASTSDQGRTAVDGASSRILAGRPRMLQRLLFICSRNRLRSPTAEHLFAGPNVETDSAGLAPDADNQVSEEQIEWADLILVMEKQHRAKLKKRFADILRAKKVVCLDVPDRYEFMQPELVALLERKVRQHLS